MLKTESTTSSILFPMDAQEEAVRVECKYALKSQIFRGYYQERRYEESISAYRDIVALQKSEKQLEDTLMEVKTKLCNYYQSKGKGNMWIGITNSVPMHAGTLSTFIWTNLENMAFGEYWFSIKTIRFYDNEILLRLKSVRPVEAESLTSYRLPSISTTTLQESTATIMNKELNEKAMSVTESSSREVQLEDTIQINIQDFVDIFRNWAVSLKMMIYDFLKHDINRHNVKAILRFLGLLIVSLISFAVVAIKHFGIFALGFMFEISRFTRIATPIVIKLIDVVSKTIGGFYILLAMIWKDLFGKRNSIKNQLPENLHMRSIQYNKQPMRKIGYNSNYERLDAYHHTSIH